MSHLDKQGIRHELESIAGLLTTCFHRLSADRRSKNEYSVLGRNGIHKLEILLEELDREIEQEKQKTKNNSEEK